MSDEWVDEKKTFCRFCGDPIDPGCENVCMEASCLSKLAYEGICKTVIPSLYIGGFDTFPVRTETLSAICDAARAWASGFDKTTQTGLFLTGPGGCGKTGIACAILKEVGMQGYRIGFANIVKLLMSFQATFRGEGSTGEIEDALLGLNLLVLDDIGAEGPSRYAAGCLYSLINQANNHVHPILIVTSNYSAKQTLAHYRSGGGEGFPNMKRVISRLEAITEPLIKFPGLESSEHVNLRLEENKHEKHD